MRTIPGVPLVYVKRSVMVMEPMADSSEGVREGMERGKFRSGLRSKRDSTVVPKRKREYDDNASVDDRLVSGEGNEERVAKKKRIRGLKGPNPLSIKKPKTKSTIDTPVQAARKTEPIEVTGIEATTQPDTVMDIVVAPGHETQEGPCKRKRKRKHNSGGLEKLLSASTITLAAQQDGVET